MKTIVKCPHCGSYNTKKTSNGKLTNSLATVGSILGGTLLELGTGIPGILGAHVGYRQTWHQFCCHDCHEPFKVRMGLLGDVKETKRY